MAITIDPSSPSLVASVGGGQVTASFNPPSSSVLAAIVFGYSSGGVSVTNNGAALTWSLATTTGGTEVAIYTTPLIVGRTGMTVSSSGVTGGYSALKVYVLPGGNLTNPVGAVGSGSSSTNNATVNGYTSTFAGSRGICGAWDANTLGTPTSTDDEEGFSGTWSGMAVSKAANTPAAATGVTFNLDAAGSSSPSWEWAAVEILAQPEPSRPAVYMNTATAVHRRSRW